MRHLSLALRRLRSVPGFSLAVVSTLALGIGVNTLVLSVVHGLLVRPLPFADADRLAWVHARAADESEPGALAPEEAEAVAARSAVFDGVAVVGDKAVVRNVGGRHVRWHGLWVTLGLADVLRIETVLGRPFAPADLAASKTPAMLISHERWERDLAGDRDVLGSVIEFEDNKRFRIVGVLPRGLEFPFARAPREGHGSGFQAGVQDFWVLGHDNAGLPGGMTIARVRQRVSLHTVRDDLAALTSTLAAGRFQNGRRTLTLVPLREQALGALAPALPVVQALALLVFVLACVNVAALVLVRAAGLAPVAAVRVALGATRGDLWAIQVAEAFWLAAAASGLAVGLAALGRPVLASMAPVFTALLDRVELNVFVMTAVVAMCGATTLLMSALPMLGTGRVPLAVALGRAGHRQTRGGGRLAFPALVVIQIALSVLLLLGAGALRTSLSRVLSVDAGYQPDSVIAADVLLYVPNSQPVIREIVARVRQVPGVEAVGLIHSTPLTGKWIVRDSIGITRDGTVVQTPPIDGSMVAFDYFAAMGIPLLAGRDFNESDYFAPNPRAIIINDIAAHRYFPGASPVGQRVVMFGAPREIVGVVKATRDARLDAPAGPQWYQPMFFDGSQMMIRTAGDPARQIAAVRGALDAADPRLIVSSIAPLGSIVSRSVMERRLTAQMVTAFAVIALVVAFVGLYGVMHFVVTTSRREMGVRAALGAGRARLMRMVLGRGVALAASGIAVALTVAFPLAGTVQHLLFEVRATDPVLLVATALLTLVVSIAASGQPAWRAGSVDPARVLSGR